MQFIIIIGGPDFSLEPVKARQSCFSIPISSLWYNHCLSMFLKPFKCTSTTSSSPTGPVRLTNLTACSNVCLFTQYATDRWLCQVPLLFMCCFPQTTFKSCLCACFDLSPLWLKPNQAWLSPEDLSSLWWRQRTELSSVFLFLVHCAKLKTHEKKWVKLQSVCTLHARTLGHILWSGWQFMSFHISAFLRIWKKQPPKVQISSHKTSKQT